MLQHLDLFSGIGGFAYGLEKAGDYQTIAFCEIDRYCQKLLLQHWPGRIIVEDIYYAIESLERVGISKGNIDIITAGFPCQPFSEAGKRQGTKDERHLWPILYRTICHFRPHYIILENVTGVLSIQRGYVFGKILRDLAACGYNAEWQVLSAAAFGASHIRERLYLVAYSSCNPSSQSFFSRDCNATKEQYQTPTNRQADRFIFEVGRSPYRRIPNTQDWLPEPDIFRMAYGLPDELDRIKGLGNAVVPQIVEWIGKRIVEHYQAIVL